MAAAFPCFSLPAALAHNWGKDTDIARCVRDVLSTDPSSRAFWIPSAVQVLVQAICKKKYPDVRTKLISSSSIHGQAFTCMYCPPSVLRVSQAIIADILRKMAGLGLVAWDGRGGGYCVTPLGRGYFTTPPPPGLVSKTGNEYLINPNYKEPAKDPIATSASIAKDPVIAPPKRSSSTGTAEPIPVPYKLYRHGETEVADDEDHDNGIGANSPDEKKAHVDFYSQLLNCSPQSFRIEDKGDEIAVVFKKKYLMELAMNKAKGVISEF